jgi:predicted Fe-S protein YdhL (DUF1289 family)
MNDMPTERPAEEFPESPCIDVCNLNKHDVCTGCKRTLEEIASWSQMSAEEQWCVVRSLSERPV